MIIASAVDECRKPPVRSTMACCQGQDQPCELLAEIDRVLAITNLNRETVVSSRFLPQPRAEISKPRQGLHPKHNRETSFG